MSEWEADDLSEEDQRRLYAPLQAVIERNLRNQLEKLQVELAEKRGENKKLQKQREDVGVKLYGTQQQLAKVQLVLDETHENANTLRKLRVAAEESKIELNTVFQNKQEENADIASKLSKHQLENDKLNQTIRNVQLYRDQLGAEIAVTRRATYKAEETVSNMEREKQKQDYIIDDLTQQTRTAREQLALLEAQLLAQSQETASARGTLHEAAGEIEKLSFEKKQLFQQWQSCVIGMQRRDEALKTTEDAIRKQQEEMMVLDNEVQGVKAQIRAAQEQNEKLTSIFTKIQTDSSFLTRCLEGNTVALVSSYGLEQERRAKLNEQYSMLRQSLEHTDEAMGRVVQELKGLQDEVTVVSKGLQLTAAETQKLDEQISQHLSNHTTLQRCTQATQDGAEKIRKTIHEKEMEVTQLQNELARIRIDILNTSSHNEQLRTNLQSVLDLLKEREKLTDKYDVEIRRRNDELEKKQAYVDSLNRKFDALSAKHVDENNGPLEATIYNLQKSIIQKDRENQDMQHMWVKRQTELVSTAGEASAEQDKIHDLSAQYTVQTQRKLRFENKLKSETLEQKQVDEDIRHAHNDMARLNDLISRNKYLRVSLKEAIGNLEKDFQAKLAELEDEATKTEEQLLATQKEKERLMEDIVEVERQIMLYERKIQLSREMQDAIDPEVGHAEAAGMRKEIQRMALRYTQLQKHQRELLQSMEKSIYRREAIASAGKLKASKAKGETLAGLRRAIEQLRGDVARITADAQVCEEEHQQFEMEQHRVAAEVDEERRNADAAREREEQLQLVIVADLITKQKNLEELEKLKRMTNKYKLAEEGKFKPAYRDEALLDRDLAVAEQRVAAVVRVVEGLRGAFPQYQEPLSRMLASPSA